MSHRSKRRHRVEKKPEPIKPAPSFMDWLRHHSLSRDVQLIRHLPLLERLQQRASRQAIYFFLVGIMIMLFGVEIALWSKDFESHWAHRIGDMVGYLIHAIGAIPCIRHVEPLFLVLFGANE